MSKKVDKTLKETPKVFPKVHFVASRIPRHKYVDYEARAWFSKRGYVEVDKPKNADVLVFSGGADISPSLYGQPPHVRTSATARDRDSFEKNIAILGRKKLKVGICRGAQLLNVISGGSMIQHISCGTHLEPHDLRIVGTNTVFQQVTSTHHQMMLPSKREGDREIIATAWDDEAKAQYVTSSVDKEVPSVMNKTKWEFLGKHRVTDFNPFGQDLEIVWYNNTNSLCIQSHPERMLGTDFEAYCMGLIRSKLREISQ